MRGPGPALPRQVAHRREISLGPCRHVTLLADVELSRSGGEETVRGQHDLRATHFGQPPNVARSAISVYRLVYRFGAGVLFQSTTVHRSLRVRRNGTAPQHLPAAQHRRLFSASENLVQPGLYIHTGQLVEPLEPG